MTITSGFAISEWPDTDAIGKRARDLAAAPLRPLRRDRVAADLAWFEANTPSSKASAAEAERYIPSGVQHNLAFNHPWALEIVRAQGAYLTDADGNRYLDFLQAGGPTVLGNNHPAVLEKVTELLATCGPATGLFHPYELKLAKLIHDCMPAVQQFRMLGSGTEGDMAAIRAARAYTGNAHIIKVGGGYHGWSDQLVFGMRLPGTGPLEAAGIPQGAYQLTHEVPPNDVDRLRELLVANREAGGTAAVIVEPLGPESGVHPVTAEYNQQVRELCDEFGALLVFDEVVTGFRLGLAGAQGYFGVVPDLTVFGKCVAGGYPAAGGIGGSEKVMQVFAGGMGALGKRVFVGGTLAANGLSCVAGYHAILEMDRTDAPAKAGRAGDRLRQGLDRIIEHHDLPYVAYNFGSIVHLNTTGVLHLDLSKPESKAQIPARLEAMKEFGAAYAAEGLITLAGSRIYTSMADTDAVVDDALTRFERVLASAEGAKG